MTPVEAKGIISNVCTSFRGTLADHRKIQEALRLVFTEEPKKPKKPKKEDPEEGAPKK